MSQWHDISANRRSVAYLLFSAIVLTVMWTVAVLPVRREITEVRARNRALENRIEQQKVYQPLYARLQEKAVNMKKRASAAPMESAGAPPADLNHAVGKLSAMAKANGLKVDFFSPSMAGIGTDMNRIQIQGRLEGDFPSLRQFLIALAGWPGYAGMNRLDIQSGRQQLIYDLLIRIELS